MGSCTDMRSYPYGRAVYPGLCVRVSARLRVRVYANTVNELRECQHEGSLPLGRVASQRDAAAGQAHDLP